MGRKKTDHQCKGDQNKYEIFSARAPQTGKKPAKKEYYKK